MNPLKKISILSFVVISLVIFTFSFISLGNKFLPREDVPVMGEAAIIAENWIRNFSSFYRNGRNLQLVEQKEIIKGEYEFLFSFISDDEHYGVHENEMVVKTKNTEIIEAITNNIFDEISSSYIEEDFTVKLYFASLKDGQSTINPLERVVSFSTIKDIKKVTLEELLKGPTIEENEKGYYTAIDSGTRILSFEIKDNILYIELNFDFEASGIAKQQIKSTMTQFSEINDVRESERKIVEALVIEGVPDNFIFEKDLSEGAEDIDVKYLQIILNADPETKVADTGPGSPGEESEIYNNATKEAVKSFQRKYAEETLLPAGLILSTGIVDEYTRDKLNSILKESRW